MPFGEENRAVLEKESLIVSDIGEQVYVLPNENCLLTEAAVHGGGEGETRVSLRVQSLLSLGREYYSLHECLWLWEITKTKNDPKIVDI